MRYSEAGPTDTPGAAVGLAIACLVMAATSSTVAQTLPTPGDDRARVLFEEAVQLFADERYEAALAKFEKSYELQPKAGVLYNIAMCHKAIGDLPAAIAAFEEYKNKKGDKLTADKRREIDKLVSEIRLQLGRLIIHGSEKGVVVLVDGVERGASPFAEPIMVAPGSHKVTARAEGREPVEREVVLKPGKTFIVKLDSLIKKVEFQPRVEEPVPVAPEVDRGVAPVHEEPEQAVDYEAPAAEEGEADTPSSAVSFGVFATGTAVCLIVGVATGVASRDAYDSWENNPTAEQQSRVDTLAKTANGFFIAGGVLGLGAIISAAAWGYSSNDGTDEPNTDEGGEEVTVVAVPTWAGAMLVGEF